MMRRREFIAGLGSAVAWPITARAQAYPSRSVRIIVAIAAGGATDIAARLIGQSLSERLGRFFVIENRPGANATIGTGAVVLAPADGYTLLMASTVDAINASLYQRLNYDFIRDTAPIAQIASMPHVLVVNPGLPARSVPEFIAYAKANPGRLNLGIAALGSPVHVTGELFKMRTGINVGQVQYRGEAPALVDVLAGQVQAMFATVPGAIGHIKDGRLRALAVTSAARSDVLPDIPIIADYVPGVEASFWTGIVAPKNTPVEIVDMLNKEINAGLADPKLKARFADLGATTVPGSPSDFGRFIAEETEKWSKAVKFAGVRADQQGERIRRVGVLMGWSEHDPVARSYLAAFVQELRRLGWEIGVNLEIEERWTNGELQRAVPLAKELVNLKPDVILSNTTPVTIALHRETIDIPIVFAGVSDPVGAGVVASLARPTGNITGFINTEDSLGGKWLRLVKEIAPGISRVAMIFNPDTAPGGGSYYLGSFEAAARGLAVEPIAVQVRGDDEIEKAITALGQQQAGLVVMADSYMLVHRGTVISSAERNKVPTIFEPSSFAREGGLMSYGVNFADLFRRAGGHVDRILRGAKPSDLPVELPVKFDMVINMKTAKALGLTVPNTLLVSADEVIE